MSEYVSFEKTVINRGFWAEKQKLVRSVTLDSVYDRFSETGRIGAFEMDYKPGDPDQPHYFWDSDVAKWIESVAYLTEKERMPEEEARVDHLVDCIERGRIKDGPYKGYFNIYFQQIAPDKIFTDRDCHELYCAGHLLEAAIAYEKATGKGKFLSLMKDYMELVKRVFMDEQSASFSSPGHEEIELALVKLYDHTGEEKWLNLAQFFVNKRATGGKPGKDSLHSNYSQDHLPAREQLTAWGHCVRACYFYCAMADVAKRRGDRALARACKSIFDNIAKKKMYITGAIGSQSYGERFEEDYKLPNDTAYAETCAALSLALFAHRMACLDSDSKYADVAERVIYNGFLSGLSLDGTSFFYENAQEIDLKKRLTRPGVHFPITQRVKVFSCSCCPPNVTRFIPSIGDFLYRYDKNGIYVEQFMDSDADVNGVKVCQRTDYPFDGRVDITVSADTELNVRVPGWCREYSLEKNGRAVNEAPVNGYLKIKASPEDKITLRLIIEPELRSADRRVNADKGLCAVTYGPFVMCAEGVDNKDLDEAVITDGEMNVVKGPFGLPAVTVPASPSPLFMIPYHAFANRGEADMKIWIKKA